MYTMGGHGNLSHSEKDREAYGLAEQAFEASSTPLFNKLEAFARFTTKRSIARFLAHTELFQRILPVNGIIVECGVLDGASLFTWAQLSNIFEPVNHTRKIVGFDTFEGFPSVNDDVDNQGYYKYQAGDTRGSEFADFDISIDKFNHERHLSHIPLIELVKGDFNETGPKWAEDNPVKSIALLYLDFDLYEPTKTALEVFLPRMPKGAIVAFDELNHEVYPGETIAYDEVMGIRNHELHRFPHTPHISYVVL